MPSPQEYADRRLASPLTPVLPEQAPEQSSPDQPPTPPAAKATGGRARSSMNALRHGLTARVVVRPTEDMAAYRAFSKELVDSLDPQTSI
jgi:hypothetical protein